MNEKCNQELETTKRVKKKFWKWEFNKSKNTAESLNNSLDQAEDRISELEDKSFKISPQKPKKEQEWREPLTYFLGMIKGIHIWISGIPEGKEKWKAIETYLLK